MKDFTEKHIKMEQDPDNLYKLGTPVLTSFEQQEKLNDLKAKLFSSIGSPYGLSLHDGAAILNCETKEEINEILKKYSDC